MTAYAGEGKWGDERKRKRKIQSNGSGGKAVPKGRKKSRVRRRFRGVFPLRKVRIGLHTEGSQ